ncbi:MAG: monomethylamine:corrinoid methyltransferase [Candidatus Bathyarchaeota archaeon]|nr:monomethylamine:corrinoid methyltransferase [Candidatus Bathyarchaeota archaeon]
MISLLEVAERSQQGPKLAEKEWNLGMFAKMKELTKKHQLEIPAFDNPYDVDQNYANRLFAAAIDYLCEIGVYCVTTNRVIRFTENEVKEACKEAPSELSIGTDRDVRTLRQRTVEDPRPPNISTGGHSAWNEALMPLEQMVKELVQVLRVDFLEGFNYHQIMGREVHGNPLVVYAARKAIERTRLGVQLAGRAGLALCYYPILTTAAALIAPKDEQRGLRSSDGILLSVLPDLKVESELIAAAIYYEEYGCFRQNGGVGGAVGGFAGGWEGAMIEAVVRNIAAWMVYHDAVQYQGSVDRLRQSPWALHSIRSPRKSDEERAREKWCSFAVHTALSRHKNTIMNAGAGSGGRVTDQVSVENLLWTARDTIRGTILGVNLRCVRTPPPTTVQWVVEISDATLKSHLSLMELDEILERIQHERLTSFSTNQDPRMLLYSNPHLFFKSHQQCYDYEKQQPTNQFLANRRAARKYLENIGLTL